MSYLRRGVALTLLVTLLGLTGVLPGEASAAPKPSKAQVKKEISSLKEQLNEVSGDESDLLGRLDEINNRKSDIEAQVGDVQAQMDSVQRDLNAANAKLEAAQDQVNRSQAALEQAQIALAANTEKLQDQAVNAYIGKEPMAAMSKAILKSEDLGKASAASAYMRQIVADRRKVVEDHRELEGQARSIKQGLEKLRQQAEAERGTVAVHQFELTAQKTQLDGLNSQVQAEASAQNALLAEAESKKAQFESRLADLQAESDSVGAALRSDPGNAGPPPPLVAGKTFSAPVPGARMTSPFGYRIHSIFGTRILHSGQDYGVPIGTGIRAAADGTVARAGTASGYGNYTCINHGGGLASCYAHQSQILVSVGQRVTRGQIIGKSGNTGNSTGPHLHFEARVNGNPVDPRSYL